MNKSRAVGRMSCVSERLLHKLKKQFPEIKMPDNSKLLRIRGNNDGTHAKWFNFVGTGESALVSYETMGDCLKFEIAAKWHNGTGNADEGWEIYLACTDKSKAMKL